MFYFLQDAVFLAVADFFNDVIYIYIIRCGPRKCVTSRHVAAYIRGLLLLLMRGGGYCTT